MQARRRNLFRICRGIVYGFFPKQYSHLSQLIKSVFSFVSYLAVTGAFVSYAQMKRRAQADIEYARIAASQQMWQEAEDMLLALSGEIVGRAVTHEDNLRLLYESIEKLKREQTGGR